MLPPLDIADLSPQALRALAEYLAKLSKEIESHAAQRESIQAANEARKELSAATKPKFFNAGAMVLSYVDAGTPIENAINLIMAATGYDYEISSQPG